MPGIFEYTCGNCGFKEEVLYKEFFLCPEASPPHNMTPTEYKAWEREHFAWLKSNTRRYTCDACWLILSVPINISLSDWKSWKASNERGHRSYSKYPFVQKLVLLIERHLIDQPGASIDLGSLSCPYCNKLLEERGEFKPVCPQCGSGEAKFGGHGVASLPRGKVWPPIA